MAGRSVQALLCIRDVRRNNLEASYSCEVFYVVGHQRYGMPHSVGRDPRVVIRNGSSVSLSLRNDSPVAASDFMVVRNHDMVSQGCFKFLAFLLAPVLFLCAEVKFTLRDKCSGALRHMARRRKRRIRGDD